MNTRFNADLFALRAISHKKMQHLQLVYFPLFVCIVIANCTVHE